MSGFYLMHRGWMDNPALGGAREPFCRRAAWAWLIENAVYQDTRTGIGKKSVTLTRGQLTYSLRFLAGAWGWDDPKVRRFLARLVEEGMIVCVTDAGQTLITICNYDEYQRVERVTDAPTDADATQERRSGDAKKNEGNQGNEDNTLEAPASRGGARPDAPGAVVTVLPKTNPRDGQGSRLPEGWELPDDWRLWAESQGLDPPRVDREADKFRDYWRGKAGKDGRKSDWSGTWRNWIRRVVDDTKGSHHVQAPRQIDPSARRQAILAGMS